MDLAADVDSANDRKPGCFVRNADFGSWATAAGGGNKPDYAGAPGEVFDKGLICP
jgi:hypothetical protein